MNELTDRRQRGAEITASGTDQAVEEHVKTDLANAFPDDGFWGEESGGVAATSLSVADPIDGASNFTAGLPPRGTSLAYVKNGEVLLGFLVFPQRDLIYQAVRGGGGTCKHGQLRNDPRSKQAVRDDQRG
jgi:myo-inositol-1(or 4)-monophosphatase